MRALIFLSLPALQRHAYEFGYFGNIRQSNRVEIIRKENKMTSTHSLDDVFRGVAVFALSLYK